MQTDIETLISKIEAVAAQLGISPGTVGERAGQGGHFYKRLKAGKLAWPHTIKAVHERLEAMQGEVLSSAPHAPCDPSHVHGSRERQADQKPKGKIGKRRGAA